MPKARKSTIGKLPPRYSFILNPHEGTRLSKCPLCLRLTFPRKFALFIHVDEWGPMALGKTCKYCSRCELIMVHQDELEAQLAYRFSKIAPEFIGNEYLVIGTVDKRVWKRGLEGSGGEFGEMLKHIADFNRVYNLHFEPGGWYPADGKR